MKTRRDAKPAVARGWFHGAPRQARPVEIAVYNFQWPAIFERERGLILDALRAAGFGGRVAGVEHVGSTSVPRLGAKPIIDVMVGVKSPDDVARFPAAALGGLGYVPRPFVLRPPSGGGAARPGRTAGRLLFSRYAAPAVNVHVFVRGDARWRGLLAVRDRLRADPKVAVVYEHLKRVFASRYPASPAAYAAAKRSFLDSFEAVALRSSRAPAPRRAARGARAPARRIVRAASADGSSPPLPTTPAGDPTGWPVGVWYQGDSSWTYWSQSPTQDPWNSGAIGNYSMWNGQYWSVVSRGADGSILMPDLSQLLSHDPEDDRLDWVEVTREDGTMLMVVDVPPGNTSFTPPDNAVAETRDDGSVEYKYNSDGSPWVSDDVNGAPAGDQGGDGTGDDGGDGGSDGGQPEPSPYTP